MPKVVCALAELKKSQAAWGCPDLMYVRDGGRSLTHPLGGVGWVEGEVGGGGGFGPKLSSADRPKYLLLYQSGGMMR
jgi:hypothetical protein